MSDVTGLLINAFLSVGALLTIIGAIGFFRFRDFFSRTHASTLTTVGGVCMGLFGLFLKSGPGFLGIKILIIIAFILFTSPTSTHALSNAAYIMGLAPKMKKDGFKRQAVVIKGGKKR